MQSKQASLSYKATLLQEMHAPLCVDEFCGFALADSFAPVIFINARDNMARRIFTFAHKLACLLAWHTLANVSSSSSSRQNSSVACAADNKSRITLDDGKQQQEEERIAEFVL